MELILMQSTAQIFCTLKGLPGNNARLRTYVRGAVVRHKRRTFLGIGGCFLRFTFGRIGSRGSGLMVRRGKSTLHE
jgi:hypothetical protein